jgi:hypothetical protein
MAGEDPDPQRVAVNRVFRPQPMERGMRIGYELRIQKVNGETAISWILRKERAAIITVLAGPGLGSACS